MQRFIQSALHLWHPKHNIVLEYYAYEYLSNLTVWMLWSLEIFKLCVFDAIGGGAIEVIKKGVQLSHAS